MRKFHKDESGLAVVEATILLPFCMIMVIAIYYAAIFMCQKANLQANLQNALIYYKNVESDTYVVAGSQMDYSNSSGTVGAVGSNYGTPTELFPYRFFGMKFDKTGFESFFRSMCGNMFFDTGSNVTLTTDKDNYIIYKTISATAKQSVSPAISLSMLGLSDSMEIAVTGEVVVTDSDDLISNVDFIIDIVSETSLGKKATEMVDKAVEWYNKFKTKFNIS